MRLTLKVTKTAIIGLLVALPASGLIFRDGPSPAANTETAPTGEFAGSGWQYQVRYFTSHATIISPKHFITAAHLGTSQEEVFQAAFFNGVEDRRFSIKGEPVRLGESDLRVFEIWETFDDYAGLYTKTDEVGKGLVIHGRGVGRGEELAGQGWKWGPLSSQKSRWGRNEVKGALVSFDYDFLYFSFDDLAGQDEVGATGRDSGGGWFLKDGDTWKLAAVSSSVDGQYATKSRPTRVEDFHGAFYSADGLYVERGDDYRFVPSFGRSEEPGKVEFYRQSHTYGSRISSHVDEIEEIIAPAIAWESLSPVKRFEQWLSDHGARGGAGGDFDRDGLSNLEEYFSESNPADTQESRPVLASKISSDGNHQLILRETLDLEARGLKLLIESSSDLINWIEEKELVQKSGVRLLEEGVRVRYFSKKIQTDGPIFYRVRISL